MFFLLLIFRIMARPIPSVSSQCFGDGWEVLNVVFGHLSQRALRSEREVLYQSIGEGILPDLRHRHLWTIVDRTSSTRTGEDFYLLYIHMGDRPSEWFRNLRMLQIRVKLGLIDTYCMDVNGHPIRMSEIICKIDVIAGIVGRDRLINLYVPPLRIPRTIREFPRMSVLQSNHPNRLRRMLGIARRRG